MQYLVAGMLKPGAEAQLQDYGPAWNEHISQPFRRIRLAAVLREDDHTPKGYLAVIEADSMADAEAYLHQSPFYAAGLYERYQIAALDVLVGSIS